MFDPSVAKTSFNSYPRSTEAIEGGVGYARFTLTPVRPSVEWFPEVFQNDLLNLFDTWN